MLGQPFLQAVEASASHSQASDGEFVELNETAGSCTGTSDDEYMHLASGASEEPPPHVADKTTPPLHVAAKTALDEGGGRGASPEAPRELGDGVSSSLIGGMTFAEADAAAALAAVGGLAT